MLRSNGEEHNELLKFVSGSPTLGVVGQSAVFRQPSPAAPEGEQGALIATIAAHYVGIAERNLAEGQKAFQAQMQEQFAKFREQIQEDVFRKRPEESGSPFVPDRITGPIRFMRKLAEIWNLSTADVAIVLGFEQEDQQIVEGLLAGRTSLRGHDIKDRIAALFRIRSLLDGLFRDASAERVWLNTPRPEFGGESPLDLLRQGSMEKLLTLRQYVEHISGL